MATQQKTIKYIEMTPLPGQLRRAKKQHNIFMQGCIAVNERADKDDWFAGCVAEQVLLDYFPLPIEYVSKLGHDFELEGRVVEVKTHVVNNHIEPNNQHHLLISQDKIGQINDDAYIFAMEITKDLSRCWLCGWIELNEFKDVMTPKSAGEVQRVVNGKKFTYGNDSCELRFEKLKGFRCFNE